MCPLPVSPSGSTALTDGRVGCDMSILVLEVRQRQCAHHARRVGLRDVEHRDAAPAADKGAVILEVHARRGAGDVVERVDVPDVASGGSVSALAGRFGTEPSPLQTMRAVYGRQWNEASAAPPHGHVL